MSQAPEIEEDGFTTLVCTGWNAPTQEDPDE